MDRSTGGISYDEVKGVIIDMKLLKLFRLGRWSIDGSDRDLVAAKSKFPCSTTVAGFLSGLFVRTDLPVGLIKPLGYSRRGV